MSITKHGLLLQLKRGSHRTKAEGRLVAWIGATPEKVLNLSIRELAEKAGVSEATVVRTCQRLGYAGFPQFKLSLAFELSAQSEQVPAFMGDVQVDDRLDVIVNKVFHASVNSVSRSLEHLDMAKFTTAVNAILAARSLVVMASGSQGHLVDRFCARFQMTGLPCTGWRDPAQQLAGAAIMDPADVLLVFSHSGRWRNHIKAIELAKGRGATTIAVTNFEQSPVGRLTDIPIVTRGDDLVFYSESMGSEIAQIVIMDCLLIGVASRRIEIVKPNLVMTRTIIEESLRQ